PCKAPEAMLATAFLLWLAQGLIQYPQQAGDRLDEASRERMQQRAEYLNQQMVQLLEELEQKNLEQSGGAWGALLVWQFWALTGIMVLLVALWFGLGKIRRNPDNSEGEEDNAAGLEEDKRDAKREDDAHNTKGNLGRPLEERIELHVVDLDKGCSLVMELMDKLTDIFGQDFSNHFYPVPQQAIGVGSAFEGWSPHAQDAVYRVLVPLSPPPGHAFHLELDAAGMLQRNFCVRVELLCTCRGEQLREDMLCFLHHSEEELRRKQDPSLLQTLCTGSYLDVEKTVQWFYRFLRAARLFLPPSCHWHLMLQPCSRSCKFQLSRDTESFTVEVIFGVRQGDTDVFVGSQPTEVGAPSTTWRETYAVAEAKFFRHISGQAPQDSWHCKCLQFLSCFPMGVGFSSYALKTVVMHLLSTRLMDILKYLRCSLETKRLHHFVIGNEKFPREIKLPSGLRLAQPPNLLEPLASSPEAHTKAVQEYIRLLHTILSPHCSFQRSPRCRSH
uniref:Mab-21-like HhH/H2TH-like domain-containing protein n=1 Tax=Cyanistes caeruleus TaxID=156563 RepID=A0A8C0U617_CYACU